MKKELKNKIKAGLVMFAVDFVSTIITLSLLGCEIEFTKQFFGIIILINILTTVLLSQFKLIEDGK